MMMMMMIIKQLFKHNFHHKTGTPGSDADDTDIFFQPQSRAPLALLPNGALMERCASMAENLEVDSRAETVVPRSDETRVTEEPNDTSG